MGYNVFALIPDNNLGNVLAWLNENPDVKFRIDRDGQDYCVRLDCDCEETRDNAANMVKANLW